jgi:hypothetical protein
MDTTRTDLEYYVLSTALLVEAGANQKFRADRGPRIEVSHTTITITWPSGKVVVFTAKEAR